MLFTKADFLSKNTNDITQALLSENKDASEQEAESWINTISVLKAGLLEIQKPLVVALEFKLPFSLRRIDATIIYSTNNKICFDVIEFKQWENIDVVGVPQNDEFSIYFRSFADIRLNPIIQLNSYVYTLKSSYKEFHDELFALRPILVMNNYDLAQDIYLREVPQGGIVAFDKTNIESYFSSLNSVIDLYGDEASLINAATTLTYLSLPNNVFDWIESERIKLKHDELIVYRKTIKSLQKGLDIVISGSAGSGKTILGLNLAKKLLDSNINVIYASANEIKSTFEKQSKNYLSYNSIFRVFRNAISNIENNVVLIVDEAHRMQADQLSKVFFQKTIKRFTVIWLIDSTQGYRPLEDVTDIDIMNNYSKDQIRHYVLRDSQFRCAGNVKYIEFCRQMFNTDGKTKFHFENIEVVNSFQEGITWYNSLDDSDKGIVASDCWAGGKIDIEGYRLTTIQDFGVWMCEQPSSNPVSVYKAQGMQKNYILFIWGNEFIYRKDYGWKVQKNCVKDRAWVDYFKSGQVDESYVQRKFANLYYVLLTRFNIRMKIYCVDKETNEYLKLIFN